ncbi:cupin domain-containing protein [Glaciibacter sp. 2TAF33]|uniref:cupin domain-containing protein n=1 Tax=Glaciibacter sp. 2TAF33 TaxID=3233015 RepID=UPI003F905FAD
MATEGESAALATNQAKMNRITNRDDQTTGPEHNLVVHSSEVEWLSAERTGNPSRIGLLPRVPTLTSKFMRQLIPATTATDLQRHVHESIHYVISGTGYSEIGTSVVEWAPGDFVYTPPWIWHRHYAHDEVDVEMLIIENSRILDAMDANQRESLGNVSFREHFGVEPR